MVDIARMGPQDPLTTPVRQMGVYDLKRHLSRVLDEVQRGGVIDITRHGRVIARLEPAEPQPPRDPRLVAAEMAEVFRDVRRRSRLGSGEWRDLLDEGRT
jgi:prevent-host-death family protein